MPSSGFPGVFTTNDPAWVPPLLIERKAFLDRKRHPFYRHGDAALFLARKNAEIVGRIMASDDPNYNAVHQSNVGCFGLLSASTIATWLPRSLNALRVGFAKKDALKSGADRLLKRTMSAVF